MALINILSPHVADMIAAGEVVERPASVVKELMENAFDAGATALTVEIRGGGATYIRVSDDGCGMAPEDAGMAFMRHATSKLHDEHGLESIGTMGFRGEALAAIAAVSEIELYTRRRGDHEGTFVTLSAGDIQDMGPVGCSDGTVMVVKNLFYNTPARLKFLKSDRSEAAACLQTAMRCALGRPDISVRFIRDGKEEFFSPGDGKQESCIYSLLGRELARDMLKCQWEDAEMKLSGFVSSPAAARGKRSAQFFYCNGRYFRSAMLQTAVEQAYKNCLLPGRYPACVIYLELSHASVDVHVHPAKTEIKFSQEKRVFDLVYQAVLSALQSEDRLGLSSEKKEPAEKLSFAAPTVPKATTPAPASRAAGESVSVSKKPREDFFRSMSAQEFRESKAAPSSDFSTAFHAYEAPYQTRLDMGTQSKFTQKNVEKEKICEISTEISENSLTKPTQVVEKAVQSVEKPVLPEYRIIGEAMKLYILVEHNDTLLLIDKHAVHERMIFDRLKAAGSHSMAQTLLAPVTLRLDGEDMELITRHGELFNELGFELEEYGEREYILRAVPADMNSSDAEAAMEEILEKLRHGHNIDPEAARDEILHTTACKAAIKAGYKTERQELEKLVEAVLSGAVRYCPHGRPVSAKLERKDLDRLFKRIV